MSRIIIGVPNDSINEVINKVINFVVHELIIVAINEFCLMRLIFQGFTIKLISYDIKLLIGL